jgi:hypothetical protein
MQNRSTKKWLDIQIVIATLAMTFVLALWNLFARESRSVASVVVVEPLVQPASAVNSSAQPQTRILLGGPAPQAQSPSVVSIPLFAAIA